jgi:DNA transformation protein and related proteins
MPPKHDGFKDFVLDQLADLHGLTCRAMFGGYGLSSKGTFFGIIHKGRLYFKVTITTVEQYQAHGMKPFRPNAKQTLKNYYEVPLEILEHSEHLAVWASQAAER